MLDTNKTSYKIGAVSRITGIGSETLRAWERRYNAVSPLRSESGDRQYSRSDVEKLLTLKTFVDSGVAIGSVAHLEPNELKKRIESDQLLSIADSTLGDEENTRSDKACRVALVGEGFPLRVLDGLEDVRNIEIACSYNTIDEIETAIVSSERVDVVIVEQPTINKNTKSLLQKIRNITGAWHVILLYGFSNQERIEQIQSSQTTVVRSSIDVQELARLAIYHSGGSERLPRLEKGSTLHFEQSIPTRIYSNKQLAELAGISNTIKCECPKHISDLVRNLVAFEVYCAECENENVDDAALHAYLHSTTAQARSMLEEALSHLIRIEGISLT